MEQLALAAVTVNVWALEAGSTALIVGNVIANGVGETPAPRLYVSPRHTPHPIHGGRQKRRYGDRSVHLQRIHGAHRTPREGEHGHGTGTHRVFSWSSRTQVDWTSDGRGHHTTDRPAQRQLRGCRSSSTWFFLPRVDPLSSAGRYETV
ncbi:hypothetical protein PF008_g16427 [Phytophthora fragariae]|uniref:Uncharacterized protein n=1 Tax=Phytophthora fragariae TaxID=53985 RepID=A0A6G0RBA0_9STRA|nr:hypothetical protein PF008_g16427 [Phytophthora fragariae]